VRVAEPIVTTLPTDSVTTLPPDSLANGPTGPISEGLSSGVPTGPIGGTGVATVPGTTIPPEWPPPAITRPLITPAPALPAPGAEQPADVEAARQAVTQTVANAMDGAASNETHAAAIEGGAIWLPAFQALRSGQFGPQVNSAKTVVLGVVFLTPTRATVEFRSDLGTGGISGPYVGDVILTGDGWRVAKEFYCRLIGPAGVTCP
jgi:hypothetical protein